MRLSFPLRTNRTHVSHVFTPHFSHCRSGSSLPHIVDIKWRLNYTTKTSQLERVNDPQYAITLQTEVGSLRTLGAEGRGGKGSLCSLPLHPFMTITCPITY